MMFKKIFIASLIFVFAACSCSYGSYKERLWKRSSYNSVTLLGIEINNQEDEQMSITATAFAIDKDHLITAGHFCVGVMTLGAMAKSAHLISVVVSKDSTLVEGAPNWRIVNIDIENDICFIEQLNHRINSCFFG